MGKKVVKVMAYVLGTIGLVASGASSLGCWVIFLDEPTMPKSLIEK
jgi:cyclic lactone autoinducer peptide